MPRTGCPKERYHSMTWPSPLSAIEGFPQYLPVTPPISPNPSRIGILAPSASTGFQCHGQLTRGTDNELTWWLWGLRTNHLSHIGGDPARTASIDGQTWILAGKYGGQRIDARFADAVCLLWPTVLAFGTIAGTFLSVISPPCMIWSDRWVLDILPSGLRGLVVSSWNSWSVAESVHCTGLMTTRSRRHWLFCPIYPRGVWTLDTSVAKW